MATTNHEMPPSGVPAKGRCGKREYPDKKAAVSAINAALRPGRRHRRPDALKAYRCPECHCWHLSHRNKPDRKRTRAERGQRQALKRDPRKPITVESWLAICSLPQAKARRSRKGQNATSAATVSEATKTPKTHE